MYLLDMNVLRRGKLIFFFLFFYINLIYLFIYLFIFFFLHQPNFFFFSFFLPIGSQPPQPDGNVGNAYTHCLRVNNVTLKVKLKSGK